MNWTDLIAPLVKLGAPLLGGALGGPLGAAAGKIVADAFGASEATPAAVDAAIKSIDPAAAAQTAQAAEDKWLAALADIGKTQLSEVGQTMRAEAASGDLLQRWWRPLYALELSLIECPAFALTLLRALWIGHDTGINGFATLATLLIAYFGARFGVLGVYVTGRSREKQCAATGESVPGLVAQVVKALREEALMLTSHGERKLRRLEYPRGMIDGPDNLARVPALKHREITGWYQTKNEDFGGLSPREYLRGKSWDERTRVGLDALIDYGVLEP